MRCPSSTNTVGLVRALKRTLGADAVLEDHASCVVYARDASHLTLGRPSCVVLPLDASGVARAIAVCAGHGRPFVMRGAGTGLAGGALPPDGAVVIATGRLNNLGAVDLDRRRVFAGVGVVNEVVSRHAAPFGLRFAPDPSSQSAASLGGNIAVNAGGPHCLKVGVTTEHVRRIDWVDARGRTWTTGRGAELERGPDIRALLVGSEGTLGAVVGAELDLQPRPPATAVLLAEFPRLEDATRAVGVLMQSGVLPEACEVIDRVMLAAVEEAFAFGFATDVDAVMLCEVAGVSQAVAEDSGIAARLLLQAGARDVTVAHDKQEQARLWTCRKKAFGAVGRLAPAYVSMDVVVPLGALTPLVQDIQRIRTIHGVEIATALHAGDGNLHPGIHFDDRDADLTARAHRAADDIIGCALAAGGSCTGEHGVGIEKRHIVHRQFDPVGLHLMRRIKHLYDPDDLCNPGKKLPADGVVGTATVTVPEAATFDWDNLTVTAPANDLLADLQQEALARGLWIPCGIPTGAGPSKQLTVAGLIDAGTPGPMLLGDHRPADVVLELWAETGAGDVFHSGAPVTKNVAGYDLTRLLVGAGGILARPLAATLLLRPAPAGVGLWTWSRVPTAFTGDARREVMGILRGHGGPTAVVRERSPEAPSLWVLAAGRDRDWDLGEVEAKLLAWSEDHGLPRPRSDRIDPARLADEMVFAGLPSWCLGTPNWTLLTPREGRPDWPRPRLLLWQTHPSVLWVPDALTRTPVGWDADLVYRNGRLQPPPAPPHGVPLWILAGLRRIFDPADRLPLPDWLRTAVLEAES